MALFLKQANLLPERIIRRTNSMTSFIKIKENKKLRESNKINMNESQRLGH
jgi:hypothetical protein